MPKIKHEVLVDMNKKGKMADEKLFAEQRTNILLKSGHHYKKQSNKYYDNLRSKGVINDKQKIRLTKNHIHRIVNVYQNSILDKNPSVKAVPFNENELHDVKAASLNNSVIEWVKTKQKWRKKQKRFVHDFEVMGECFAIIKFDYSKGQKIGVDEKGNIVRLGEFVVDRAFAFDMKRDPDARTTDDVKWWIRESMMNKEEFKKLSKTLNPNLDVDEKIESRGRDVYKVFDANTGTYQEKKNQIFVMEMYMKPSPIYPNGWYAMYTDDLDIYQSELPFGIYPVVYGGFEEMTTTPRHFGIIRICRPYQVEINRAGSKIAEHQITLGDDKVFIQKGTKLTNGGYLSGTRAYQVSGKEPTVQPGRNGSQYLDYQLSQIQEMYQAANLDLEMLDKSPKSGDPYQLLFMAMRDKKRFSKYAESYEDFEIEIFDTILKMAKHYLTPMHVIRVAGRSEAMNIEEFKTIKEEGFEFKVVPQSGDIETQFGKILSATQTLQYAGSRLSPDQIGALIRQLPMGNEEQMFSTLTVDYDNAMNDILALDRGQMIPAQPQDNHQYMLNALQHRTKKSDFKFLPENIQQGYKIRIAQHQMFFAQQQQAAQRAQMGMIPTQGFLTTVNASWYNPTTNRIERIKVPSGAIEWLMEKLREQGQFVEDFSQLPLQVQADLGNANAANQQQQQTIPTLQVGAQPQAA